MANSTRIPTRTEFYSEEGPARRLRKGVSCTLLAATLTLAPRCGGMPYRDPAPEDSWQMEIQDTQVPQPTDQTSSTDASLDQGAHPEVQPDAPPTAQDATTE